MKRIIISLATAVMLALTASGCSHTSNVSATGEDGKPMAKTASTYKPIPDSQRKPVPARKSNRM